jgi:hypothetical protein
VSEYTKKKKGYREGKMREREERMEWRGEETEAEYRVAARRVDSGGRGEGKWAERSLLSRGGR